MAGKKHGAMLLVLFILGGLVVGFGIPILLMAARLVSQ